MQAGRGEKHWWERYLNLMFLPAVVSDLIQFKNRYESFYETYQQVQRCA